MLIYTLQEITGERRVIALPFDTFLFTQT